MNILLERKNKFKIKIIKKTMNRYKTIQNVYSHVMEQINENVGRKNS